MTGRTNSGSLRMSRRTLAITVRSRSRTVRTLPFNFAPESESLLPKAGSLVETMSVTFIQVNQPFTGIKPMKYQPTPTTGTKMILGVVGYPGDLMNSKSKEKGAVSFLLRVPRYSSSGLTHDSSCTRCMMVRHLMSQRRRPRCFNITLTLMEVCDN